MTKAEIAKLFWEEVCGSNGWHICFDKFTSVLDSCCRSWSDHLEEDGSLSEVDYSYEYGFDDGSKLLLQYDVDYDGWVYSKCEVLKDV